MAILAETAPQDPLGPCPLSESYEECSTVRGGYGHPVDTCFVSREVQKPTTRAIIQDVAIDPIPKSGRRLAQATSRIRS